MAMSVLLVDDNKAVRNVIGRMLVRDGYVVLSASDVREARSMLEAAGDRLTLVLTDMQLPDGSGADVAESVRLFGPGTPILSMSGADQFLGEVYLRKPFTVEQLRDCMRRVLGFEQ